MGLNKSTSCWLVWQLGSFIHRFGHIVYESATIGCSWHKIYKLRKKIVNCGIKNEWWNESHFEFGILSQEEKVGCDKSEGLIPN